MVSAGGITWRQHQQPNTTSRPVAHWSELVHGHREDKTEPLAPHVFSGVGWETSQRQPRRN
jgi:hypothetical protein